MTSTTSTCATRAARCLGAGLVALVLAAPGQARPYGPDGEQFPGVTRSTAQLVPADVHDPPPVEPPSAVPTVVVVHHDGFDVADAAVGAAATTGLVALLGAGLIVTTRSRRREHSPRAAH